MRHGNEYARWRLSGQVGSVQVVLGGRGARTQCRLLQRKRGSKTLPRCASAGRRPKGASWKPSWRRMRRFRAGIPPAKCIPPMTIPNSLVLGLGLYHACTSHVPRMYLAFTSQSPPKHMAFTWLVPPMHHACTCLWAAFCIHHSAFCLRPKVALRSHWGCIGVAIGWLSTRFGGSQCLHILDPPLVWSSCTGREMHSMARRPL